MGWKPLGVCKGWGEWGFYPPDPIPRGLGSHQIPVQWPHHPGPWSLFQICVTWDCVLPGQARGMGGKIDPFASQFWDLLCIPSKDMLPPQGNFYITINHHWGDECQQALTSQIPYLTHARNTANTKELFQAEVRMGWPRLFTNGNIHVGFGSIGIVISEIQRRHGRSRSGCRWAAPDTFYWNPFLLALLVERRLL